MNQHCGHGQFGPLVAKALVGLLLQIDEVEEAVQAKRELAKKLDPSFPPMWREAIR